MGNMHLRLDEGGSARLEVFSKKFLLKTINFILYEKFLYFK